MAGKACNDNNTDNNNNNANVIGGCKQRFLHGSMHGFATKQCDSGGQVEYIRQ